MSRMNTFAWGWFVAWTICWALMYFGFARPRAKTIARLEAENDSLLAVKTSMREAGTAISMPPNSQVLIRTEQKDDKLIFQCWDVPLRIWKQDKNGKPYAWVIYGDSIRKWPPDTLKHKPMKRREK